MTWDFNPYTYDIGTNDPDDTTMTFQIPDGYVPFAEDDGYIGHNGPYYAKEMPDGKFRYGFKTDARHGNPNGVIHGAALIGFADTTFGHLIVRKTGRFCATVSLTTEFISGAPAGGWVEATVHLKRATKNLAFANAEVFFEDQLLLSATSIFKLFGERPQ